MPMPAQRQQPSHDLRQVEPLRDAEAEMRGGFGGPRTPQPAPAADAVLHAEDGVRWLGLKRGRLRPGGHYARDQCFIVKS